MITDGAGCEQTNPECDAQWQLAMLRAVTSTARDSIFCKDAQRTNGVTPFRCDPGGSYRACAELREEGYTTSHL